MDVLVHHEGVGAGEPKLHEHVGDAVDVVEVAEEHDGARYREGEVENQVGEHDDVGLVADDFAPPGDVGDNDILIDDGWELVGEVAQVE